MAGVQRIAAQEVCMRSWFGVLLVCVAALSAVGQTPSSKYQPGTIMAVTAHRGPGQPDADVTQYDVSVKVGNTTYVVLYTPLNGANIVKYSVGDEWLVLVGSDTLTINTAVSGKTEIPILSRETAPSQNLDWSKAPDRYFSMKLQNLSEKLSLTEDQQAKIKPVLEQEAGQVGEICVNPVLSDADKLSQYRKLVRASDEKIKPLLSSSQWQKLEVLRKEQKQDLKKIIAEQRQQN
jgi:hypothetical protein